MSSIWFQRALLPHGWEDCVRITIKDAKILTISPGAVSEPGDARCAVGISGLGNLHSHAFQRGMAGRAEIAAGGGRDDFWRRRDVMYGMVGWLAPGDLHAIAALAYAEMLETGFTRVGEFHYLHHGPDGRPYANPAQMAAAIAAASADAGIALTLLPVFYAHAGFAGQEPRPEQRRFVCDLDGYATCTVDVPIFSRVSRARSWEWHRTRCAPRRQWSFAPSSTYRLMAPCISILPNRSQRSRLASHGADGDPSTYCSTKCPSTNDGASSTRRISMRRSCSASRRARLSWASARSPRPISATASFRPPHSSLRAGVSASGLTRMSGSTRRKNCGCSNTASG